MRDVVLDSASLVHLVRGLEPRGNDRFSRLVTDHHLVVRIDPGNALVDEWSRTVGREIVGVLVTRWNDKNGIVPVTRLGSIATISKKLKIFGFRDALDKLVLRIATATNDHIVISEDSDFWDPLDKKRKGKRNAPVERLCREVLGVLIHTLGQFMNTYHVKW